jgi:hypothetical protein
VCVCGLFVDILVVQHDLSEGLRSGVLLCFLVQSFEPRSVPRLNEEPTNVYEYRYVDVVCSDVVCCSFVATQGKHCVLLGGV